MREMWERATVDKKELLQRCAHALVIPFLQKQLIQFLHDRNLGIEGHLFESVTQSTQAMLATKVKGLTLFQFIMP